VYGDTGVTVVDKVMGSIYSADSGADRHYLISISSYHTMKVLTLSFPNFGLTQSVREIGDPCNCVDPQHRAVSYLLTCYTFQIGHGSGVMKYHSMMFVIGQLINVHQR